MKFYLDKLPLQRCCWSFEKIGHVFSISKGVIHRRYPRMCSGQIQHIGRANLMILAKAIIAR
jgi:hypothetical protein